MSEIQAFLAESSRLVDDVLEHLISPAQIDPSRLNEAVRWSVFGGGKRFRPALLLAVGRTFGAPDIELASSAAAVELIHTYSLVHDDLPAMDDDDLRRGRETCHKKFGEATAILAGDLMQTLAFQAITDDAKLSSDIKIDLLSELSRAAAKMVEGQMMDLEAEGKDVLPRDLEAIHENKTGALINFAAIAGAIIGGASESSLRAVSDFSRELGLLFQITDDLLDVTQSTHTLGKTAGKDSSAYKATYPGYYGVEKTAVLAKNVHAHSIECLARIDKATKLLREIADFVLNRKA